MFTRSGGTIALYLDPWVSRAVPFDRPNQGDPFVTVSSPEVSVELITDLPLVLAAPAAEIAEFAAGSGTAWAFTVHDVRDVALVLAPDFLVRSRTVGGVKVRAYSRRRLRGGAAARAGDPGAPGGAAGPGVDYPWPALVAVETEGGEAMDRPALVWIPRTLDTLNRTYLVHHEVATSGSTASSATTSATTRSWTRRLPICWHGRPSAPSGRRVAPRRPLIGRSPAIRAAATEVVYVQGGLLLDDIRARIGTSRFWKALAGFVEANRFGLAETRDLLDALEEAAPGG